MDEYSDNRELATAPAYEGKSLSDNNNHPMYDLRTFRRPYCVQLVCTLANSNERTATT